MDNFGDRMKDYERVETGRRFMPLLPIYARLDGRSFSKFTNSMKRPYDTDMSQLMIGITKKLVEETNALVGYTQSDEISLLFYSDEIKSQVFFDGKIQKMNSVLSSLATSYFTLGAIQHWPSLVEELNPVFDCRVFQLPNKTEAANVFLWRELDATKNAISMAARCYFSHKELQNKTGAEMQEMMFQKNGTNFNNYPNCFKRGTFIQRFKERRMLTAEELRKIPTKYQPNEPVERTRVQEVSMPKLNTVTNRVGVLFDGERPIVEENKR